jgi:hypothetical protein
MTVKLGDLPFADCKTIDEVVFQVMGLASVCWENPSGAGVFDSETASTAGQAAVKRIKELS